MGEPDEWKEYWAHWQFAHCAPHMKVKARELGYALLVHGSLSRDIDMVAVPWVENAVPAKALIDELFKVVERHATNNIALFSDADPNPTVKPHGRRAWSIHVKGTYFDISVMPLLPKETTE